MGRLLSAEALLDAVVVRKSNHKDTEDTEKNEMLYFFPLCPLCLCGDSLPFSKGNRRKYSGERIVSISLQIGAWFKVGKRGLLEARSRDGKGRIVILTVSVAA
jgi:hypothetical protein